MLLGLIEVGIFALLGAQSLESGTGGVTAPPGSL